MPKKPDHIDHHVIDLFAGVGGLSLGAARAGFKLRLAVEKDPQAFAAHSLNFPGSTHSRSDITGLTGAQMLSQAGIRTGELCGLIGGPPCQGFSTIGRRDVGDKRNGLFKKFFDLVRDTKPQFFLAENVPGIMNESYSEIRDEAMMDLSEYVMLEPFSVCAADFGAPTTRTRVLFFGYRPDAFSQIRIDDFLTEKTVTKVTVGSALAGLPTTIRDSWNSDDNGWRKVRYDIEGDYGTRLHGMIPDGVGHAETLRIWQNERKTSGCIATLHEKKTIQRFAALEAGETDEVSRGVRLDPEGFCPTLRAGTDSSRGSYQAVRPIHPSEPRVVTPREAARLQGFPDWFRFDRTKWHSFRQIGNSVSPILAEKILGTIKRKLTSACDTRTEKLSAA